jgi:pyruvate formate lyase activating enzyme
MYSYPTAYESADCVEACKGLLDAANIDLKSFNDKFYKSQCGARLQPVLDTLKRMHQAGIWLEVTTLLIPGGNDSDAELQGTGRIHRGRAFTLGPLARERLHPALQISDRRPRPHPGQFVGTGPGA